jgi:adenylosuccinate synthase
LDIVALRYAARINGLTHLAITKLDVLTGFDRISVCTSYVGPDEARFTSFPYHQSVLHHARGETIELDGWSEDLGECRVPSDLPKAARDYLRYIEENVGVRVVLVGVGPGREQIIWADESDAVPRAA